MSEDLVNLDNLDALDEMETEFGGTPKEYTTTVTLDLGYLAYVSMRGDQRDRFFSVLELGKEKAEKEWKELTVEHGGNTSRPPQYHLEIALSLGDMVGLSEDDLPNWSHGYRVFHIPMRRSAEEWKERDDWVPYAYEVYKSQFETIQSVMGAGSLGEIMRTPIYCIVSFEQDPWELWQVARAKAGERTFGAYAKDEPKIQWIPVFKQFFPDRDSASKGASLQIPPQPANWSVDLYASWDAYFLNACKLIAEGTDPTGLLFSDESGPVFTEEHIELARQKVESGEYQYIPF